MKQQYIKLLFPKSLCLLLALPEVYQIHSFPRFISLLFTPHSSRMPLFLFICRSVNTKIASLGSDNLTTPIHYESQMRKVFIYFAGLSFDKPLITWLKVSPFSLSSVFNQIFSLLLHILYYERSARTSATYICLSRCSPSLFLLFKAYALVT